MGKYSQQIDQLKNENRNLAKQLKSSQEFGMKIKSNEIALKENQLLKEENIRLQNFVNEA